MKKFNEVMKRHENKIYVAIFLIGMLAIASLLIFGRGEVITIKIVSPEAELASIESVEPIAKEDLVSIEDVEYPSKDELTPIADIESSNKRLKAIAVRTYEDGQVYNYNVQEIREPELILANVKDVTKNSYYTAELKRLAQNDEYSEIEVLTDMPVSEVYYTITDRTTGIELYRGKAGLVIHQTKNYCNIKAHKYVFESENFRPEWENEEITYYLQSGKDSSIKITPNFDTSKRFATIKPVPKPGI